VTVVIRTQSELWKTIENNPFVKAGNREVDRMYVTFLEKRPEAAREEALPAVPGTNDEFRILEKEIYLYCPGGYGKTVFSNSYFERRLGIRATTRNWKTVGKLYELSIED
jgi:uncharacterized protein (DUF1697 family)